MEIKLIKNCSEEQVYINGTNVTSMTFGQKLQLFYKIVNSVPDLDSRWFEKFLAGLCERFGKYKGSDESPGLYGDSVEQYTIKIEPDRP